MNQYFNSKERTLSTHEEDLAAAKARANLTGALTLAEARALHAELVIEAAQLGMDAGKIELMGRLTAFLEGLQ